MNAAELDLRRRALGLSIAETAEVTGVSVRTLGYWFSGDGEPRDPDEIARRLGEVEAAMGDLVDSVAEEAAEAARKAVRPRVILKRFKTRPALDASGEGRGLPLGAYLMALAWTIDDLRHDGHSVSVEWASG